MNLVIAATERIGRLLCNALQIAIIDRASESQNLGVAALPIGRRPRGDFWREGFDEQNLTNNRLNTKDPRFKARLFSY